MKKCNVFILVGAAGACIISYVLLKDEGRNKWIAKGKALADKCRKDNVSTLDEAGIPGQTGNEDPSQFENAKMVSEGSQFGVNYFNEVKEEN